MTKKTLVTESLCDVSEKVHKSMNPYVLISNEFNIFQSSLTHY